MVDWRVESASGEWHALVDFEISAKAKATFWGLTVESNWVTVSIEIGDMDTQSPATLTVTYVRSREKELRIYAENAFVRVRYNTHEASANFEIDFQYDMYDD